MFIPEIRYPGTWIEAADKDRAWDAQRLFIILEMTLARAAVSLQRFREAQSRLDALTSDDIKTVKAKAEEARTNEVPPIVQWAREHGRLPSWDEDADCRLQAEMTRMRAEWAAGKHLRMYSIQEPAVHAISFVLNLDRIGRLLEWFDALEAGREGPTFSAERFWGRFPVLRGLRDSVAHFDERSEWRVRDKELKPAAVNLPGLEAVAGNLLLENVRGDMLGATLANGEYGEVDISEATLALARDNIQEAVDEVVWRGPPRFSPY